MTSLPPQTDPVIPPWRAALSAATYVASIFTSAFLLFSVQPIAVRTLLPQLGGTPAVWNTAQVFFQITLLIGYAYAHWSALRLSPVRGRWLHAAALVAPLVVLPPVIGAPYGGADRWPALGVLAALALGVGAPFFVLASNSSLVQHWYARSGLAGGHEPYRLYAASNAGSMLALLAYPLVIEPALGLADQARAWSLGYLVFAGLSFAVLAHAARSPSRGGAPNPSEPTDGLGAPDLSPEHAHGEPAARVLTAVAGTAAIAPLDWPRRLMWLMRAAVAASLLMSTTLQVTTDVAPIPLLWIVPLAIYLATFIVAFGRAAFRWRGALVAVNAAAVALTLGHMLLPLSLPLLSFALAMPLVTLLAGALLCHIDLAADRPDPAHLTEFYLWVSAGGALGGVLNALVAPAVFRGLTEYPLTLVLLVVLMTLPQQRREGGGRAESPTSRAAVGSGAPAGPEVAESPAGSSSGRRLRAEAGGLAVAAAMLVVTIWAIGNMGEGTPPAERRMALFLPHLVVLVGVYFFILARRPRWSGGRWLFAWSAALSTVIVAGGYQAVFKVVFQDRSFFGVQRVGERGGERVLMHGTTLHGAQALGEAGRRTPRTYYFPAAPMGRLVWRTSRPDARLGLVGLGTGALAALCRPGQSMVFFEIDPLVEQIARDHFTYLADSPCAPTVVLGDGRLTLADQPDGAYDLLVIDAFSSDAIPTHLLTAEALALYRRKLTPGGVVSFHITNRYLDLAPALAGVALAADMPAAVNRWQPTRAESRQGASGSDVVALAHDPAVIARLVAEEPGWQMLDARGGVVWTDDYVNLLAVWGASPQAGE